MAEKLLSKTDIFIEKSKSRFGDKFDYSKANYTGSKNDIVLICKEDGVEFITTPNYHLSSTNGCCPECNHRSKKIRCLLDKEDFIKRVTDKHGNKFNLSTLPDNFSLNEKVEVFCIKHNKFFTVKAERLINGIGCEDCVKDKLEETWAKRSLSEEEFIIKAKDKFGEKYDLSFINYKGRKEKVLIRCVKHDFFFWITPKNFLKKGRNGGCPLCAEEVNRVSKRLPLEELLNRIKVNFEDKYELLTTSYENVWSDIEVLCKEHGEVFKSKPKYLIDGKTGCKKCIPNGYSFIEKDLLKYIKSIYSGIILENVKIFSDSREELDIYIPDLNLAIELNGIRWHSELYKNDKFYHLNKYNKCLSLGIELISIYDFEWKNNDILIKNRLKLLLGLESSGKTSSKKSGILNWFDFNEEEKIRLLKENELIFDKNWPFDYSFLISNGFVKCEDLNIDFIFYSEKDNSLINKEEYNNKPQDYQERCHKIYNCGYFRFIKEKKTL